MWTGVWHRQVNGIMPWEDVGIQVHHWLVMRLQALMERFLDTFHTIARHGDVQGAWTSEQQALIPGRGIHSFVANAAIPV
ncbi:hypothetical protein AK812_SmicGene15109 [Symbiodinium microadriaticum]|uniref:Uncharacterized protein n=1 Tax=Symbiodinium microadriaticum TaxID=2951 RepID=A0A1Q9E3U8_SYMMI|nr:hypothetical protein AK812_SmicGene15109 [Symbiodinium microadriaticum]